MNDHVAVLRRLRDYYAVSGAGLDEAAALSHAIAAIEQRDALVARLGELIAKWRKHENYHDGGDCADDLARVVKESGAIQQEAG